MKRRSGGRARPRGRCHSRRPARPHDGCPRHVVAQAVGRATEYRPLASRPGRLSSSLPCSPPFRLAVLCAAEEVGQLVAVALRVLDVGLETQGVVEWDCSVNQMML